MEKWYLSILIKRWLAGKTTALEQKKLDEHWARAVEDQSVLEAMPESERTTLQSEMYHNIWETIRQHEVQPVPLSARKQEKRAVFPLQPKVYRLVASIALFAAVGLGLYTYTSQDGMQIITTGFGKRTEVTLPDHSVVVLNGNSSIRYARAWNKAEIREVWLEGEAYFSVQHTQNHQKFIVHTPDHLQVEVLGTKFNVSNRRGDTRIVLQEGKVKVSAQKQNYVMKPGEMISYQTGQAQFIPKLVNPAPVVSWKEKVRIYRDEKILSILQDLQDSHGIRVEIHSRVIDNELFSGSIPGDSVEIIFEKIEKLYPVTVTKKEDVYILR
jgi:ferric-dicitrate binding protein FerR (iron transport regulator)